MVRYFELGIVDAINNKEIDRNIYLSIGQESVAAALSTVIREYLVFPQHRAHDIYICFGGSLEHLRDELLGLPTGSSQGKAGSNCLQYFGDGVSIFGHHGLIGENVPQGVGAALGSGKKTVCIFGDGAAEEDYVLSALGFAVTKKLPVLFICVDNNLSILTEVADRRSWELTDVAKAFGMPAVNVTDDPLSVLYHTKNLIKNLPALINCYVCRGHWHVGAGVDNEPEWDRFTIFRNQLIQNGQAQLVNQIEIEVQNSMEKIWNRKLLLKPLKK